MSQRSKQTTNKNRRRQRYILSLLIAVICGLTGSYVVFFSHADSPTVGTTTSPYANSASVYAYNGYVYNFTPNVSFARQSPDGTLGTWQNTTQPPITLRPLVGSNGYVYGVGPAPNRTAYGALYRSHQNANGTLADWSVSMLINDYLSFCGGISYGLSLSPANGYYYCQNFTRSGDSVLTYFNFNADGSVNPLKATGSLPNNLGYFGLATTGNFIYLAGGCYNAAQNCNNSTVTRDVRYARLAADGLPGSWNNTTPLPPSLQGSSLYAFGQNGFLYILGCPANASATTVWYAQLSTSGTAGDWKQAPSLPICLSNSTFGLSNGVFYSVSPGEVDRPGKATYYLGLGSLGTTTGSTGTGSAGKGGGVSGSNATNGVKGSNSAGSASATSRSAVSNPATASSPKGTTTKPPDSQPNPFYDGKEYVGGSEQDVLITNAAAKRRAGYWWWIALTVIAALLAVVLGRWWYRKQKPVLKKRKR